MNDDLCQTTKAVCRETQDVVLLANDLFVEAKVVRLDSLGLRLLTQVVFRWCFTMGPSP